LEDFEPVDAGELEVKQYQSGRGSGCLGFGPEEVVQCLLAVAGDLYRVGEVRSFE
jgi:hypothetical protein